MRRYERSLLDLALDVHMTTTGSYERAHISQLRDVADLKEALKNWKPSVFPKYAAFDSAVKQVIEAALEETGL